MEPSQELQLEGLRLAARSKKPTRTQSLVRDRSISNERARARVKSGGERGKEKSRSRSEGSRDRETRDRRISLLGCGGNKKSKEKNDPPSTGWNVKKFVMTRNRPESDSDEEEQSNQREEDELNQQFRELSVKEAKQNNTPDAPSDNFSREVTPDDDLRLGLEDIPEVADQQAYEEGLGATSITRNQDEEIYESVISDTEYGDYTDADRMLEFVNGAVDHTQALLDEKIELAMQLEKIKKTLANIRNEKEAEIMDRDSEIERLGAEAKHYKELYEETAKKLKTTQTLLNLEMQTQEEQIKKHSEEKVEITDLLEKSNKENEVMRDSLRIVRQEFSSANAKHIEMVETAEAEALQSKSRADESQKEAENWRRIALDKQKELRDYKNQAGKAISKLARGHDSIKRTESRISIASDRRILPVEDEEEEEEEEQSDDIDLQWDGDDEVVSARVQQPNQDANNRQAAARPNWADMIKANQLMRAVKWPDRSRSNDFEDFCEQVQAVADRQVSKGLPDTAIAESLHNHLSTMDGLSQKYNHEVNPAAVMTLRSVLATMKSCDKSHKRKSNVDRFNEIEKGPEEDFLNLTKRITKKYDVYKLGEPSYDQHHRIKTIRDRVCRAGKVPMQIVRQLSTCYNLDLIPIIIEDSLERISKEKSDREDQASRTNEERIFRNQQANNSRVPPENTRKTYAQGWTNSPNRQRQDQNQQRYPRNGTTQGPTQNDHRQTTTQNKPDENVVAVLRAPTGYKRINNRMFCYNCRALDQHEAAQCQERPYCSLCKAHTHRDGDHRRYLSEQAPKQTNTTEAY